VQQKLQPTALFATTKVGAKDRVEQNYHQVNDSSLASSLFGSFPGHFYLFLFSSCATKCPLVDEQRKGVCEH
jgi:hypothetical protein